MLFPTLSFAAFFAVVLPVSWLLMPHRTRWRLFMVAASWFFYGAADWRFVPLLAGSTLANQIFARVIHRSTGSARKAWTVVAVAANLAVLAWFKYVGFLSLTLQSTLRDVGIHAHVPLPEVVLPIGISFFTFQALSYVIDTSRGKIEPSPLLDFAVYLSFFPHLIAGPIVRASEFLPQIKEKIDPRGVDMSRAFWLISLGLFKKVVVASYLGTYAADPLFGFPHQHAGVEALFGVYAYAIQIYMDFSGYTDIAIGLALLLGIRFPQNFNAPYAAASLQDFWRRWHMTLSRWLRDYLYIPLGGSRQGRARTYVNVMITMLLGGLWHGAAWTFVAWGALHGVGLCVERWRHHEAPADAGKGALPVPGPGHGASPVPGPGKGASPVPARGKGLLPVPGPPSGSGVERVEPVPPRRPGVVAGVSGGDLVVARVGPADPPEGADRRQESRTPAWWLNATQDAIDDDLRPETSPPSAPFAGPAGASDAPPGAPLVPPAAPLVPRAVGDSWRSRSAKGAPPAALPATAWRPRGVGGPAPTTSPATVVAAPFVADHDDAPPAPPNGHANGATGAGSGASPPPTAQPPAGRSGSSHLSPTARRWLGWLITFHVVCFAWIFFRATSFHNAIEVMGRIADLGGRHQPFNWKAAAIIVGALAVQLGPRGVGAKLQALFSRSPLWAQALLLVGVLTVVDLMGPAGVAPFIYFRF